MILSYSDIETIAAGVMADFNSYFDAKENRLFSGPRFTPIDQFAKDYLGLNIRFFNLSDDGSFCGLTTYADTEFHLQIDGIAKTIQLKQNEVILDASFIKPDQIKKLCGKRRFTLAHECAHQILYQLESDQQKDACKRMYSERRLYTPRELKTKEDWNEWQANALGAAILMPWKEVEKALEFYRVHRPLTSYEGRFNYLDRYALSALCHTFGVSKSAMVIRLKQMGYLQEQPASSYYDPLEVWP